MLGLLGHATTASLEVRKCLEEVFCILPIYIPPALPSFHTYILPWFVPTSAPHTRPAHTHTTHPGACLGPHMTFNAPPTMGGLPLQWDSHLPQHTMPHLTCLHYLLLLSTVTGAHTFSPLTTCLPHAPHLFRLQGRARTGEGSPSWMTSGRIEQTTSCWQAAPSGVIMLTASCHPTCLITY